MPVIKRDVVLPVPRERAWELITEPAELEEWLADEVDFEAEEGAPLRVAFEDGAERYPKAGPARMMRSADLIVLPDEPYRFSADDGPDAFPGRRVAFVSGRHLFWYGPSLTEARDVLERQLYR